MASQVVPIGHLNLEPATVKCLACQHVGQSTRAMETTSNAEYDYSLVEMIGLTFFRATASCLMGILACLACNCGYMTAPTYYFLSHYCSRCGIRFSVVPWYEQPIIHLDRSVLVEVGSGEKGKPGLKVAPSPMGAPPKMDEDALRNFATRFLTWTPSLVLEIKLGDSSKFPSDVFDASTSRKLYAVTWPGLSGGQDPIEYTPAEPMTTTPGKTDSSKIRSMAAWNPKESTPHIRVSMVDGLEGNREMATAQVFATSRDYVLHTPQTSPEGVVDYVSRRTGVHGQVSGKSGYMIWNSSAGALAWIVRAVRDKELERPSRRIVLMDAYDRLVAIMCPSSKQDNLVHLRLYGTLPPGLVAEILASFSAVSYVMWNYSRLEGSDEGWGVLDGGLNVASLGVTAAGI
ncbi:hypothetical protein FZEAL_3383 [Fusarium zealandicum]|uniref:LITAF domain-containing protein n=1 Tax=Fusarium zealandicum TaxID=1053134 RepID=A0A8H4UP93_9HYPO|nr:hypothetical protein FZEAL_3383 [Fusarium zealandicum]